MRTRFAICLFVLGCIAASARESLDSAEIYFRQSKSAIDPGFMGNRENMDRLIREYKNYIGATDSSRHTMNIKVVGGASPEGSVAINHRLSDQRANAIFDYFSSMTGIDDPDVSYDFIGRDWNGLRVLVENDGNVPFRSDVLSLLDSIIRDTAEGEQESAGHLRRIKQLHGGVPYSYMYRRLFPTLRASRIYLVYTTHHLTPLPAAAVPLIHIAYLDTIDFTPVVPQVTVREKKPFYMALKTNLLYDAVALPSIGAEIYLGRNWSAIADWTYGWWDVDRRHRYWRAYGGDIGIRRWFGRAAEEKPLTGHHIGAYAGVVTYDFEFGGQGVMGGLPGHNLWDRCNFMCGIEYGYSLPVARRLNIDFTIGIGYLGGRIVKYDPSGNSYVWKSTNKLSWFGPTKAEISLVWLIGHGNYNQKKGGTR